MNIAKQVFKKARLAQLSKHEELANNPMHRPRRFNQHYLCASCHGRSSESSFAGADIQNDIIRSYFRRWHIVMMRMILLNQFAENLFQAIDRG